MAEKKLKILCSAMDSQGHVNAILGMAKILESRGHQVIMTLAPGWESLIKKHNFEFIPLDLKETTAINKSSTTNGDKVDDCKGDESKESKVNGDEKAKSTDEAPNAKLIGIINDGLKQLRLSPMDSVRNPDPGAVDRFIDWYSKQFAFDEALKQVMNQIKPDMIVLDFMMRLPCLEESTIPWAQLWSCNPIMLYHGHCPPATTGFATDSPRELWDEFKKLQDANNKPIIDHINSWFISKGSKPYGPDEPIPIGASPYMNIYTYPGFLDYNDIAPRPAKWFRMDASIREPDDSTPFVIPEKLINKQGKLIYFSLGSMGSVDLELMRRVISVLAKSPHRFIISKGPYHDQIDLPDNCWGEKYVNQIAILPHCDLVITHGGNNTLTESLYFGKPIIVMPLFFDQLDNAQRIKEKGVGLRIDTYHFEESELLEAIEKLLVDQPLKTKLALIAATLKASTTTETVCQLIEKTVATGKSPFGDDQFDN
ncbi:macrolide glycosyltransferase-like [Panonychus citri]|uniref:macrolide glycosyltransferase-like n=1 Tax=Panonychus citri TaxID=50023 RepID=UPI002307DA3D|nr:macrolide glycosyltransferase-like [Panonychus citri]